jgi:Cu2+-exporting ATPase
LRRDGFLDRALHVRQIIFDKTGTLTRGQLVLTPDARHELLALPPTDRAVLWHMTSRSNHPVSRCIAAALGWVAGQGSNEPDRSPDTPPSGEPASAPAFTTPGLDTVVEETGQGLRWRRGDTEYRFGRPDFALLSNGHHATGAPAGPGARDASQAIFAVDGRPLARLAFQEEIRRDAADEVSRLTTAGYQVHLLSGDVTAKVQRVARILGIPAARAHSDLSPEVKAAAVRRLDQADSLMVGDGLNDSLSFDAALCAATPAVDRAVLPQKADFYFLGDGIGAVRCALQAARRLHRIQRDNLTYAALYNAVAVGLCLAGLVSPVVAAILMPLSSVTIVILTSSRLTAKEASWMS